jgi:hypothetical protein
MPWLLFFIEDRWVGGRGGDSASETLSCGDMATADPATGVASVASREALRAIGGAVFRRCCGVRETLNGNCEIHCQQIPPGVRFFMLFFEDCSLVLSRP